ETYGGGGGITDQHGCHSGSGYLTVQYSQAQDVPFGGAIGLSNTLNVGAQSTAGWGPLMGAGGQLLPIMVQQNHLQGNCHVPDAPTGTTCALWYNNNDLGNADSGFMNLNGWNVLGDYNCSNAGGTD